MDTTLTLQHQQSLSQTQIQSLNILSFDLIELNGFLRTEYLENPLLDYTETFPALSSSETLKSYNNTSSFFEPLSKDTMDIPKLEDTSIKEYLLLQLHHDKYSKYEWALIQYLIDCLDDNGYFKFTPADIAAHTGTDISMVEDMLLLLRSLEPLGIFAYDLADCLVRQLDETDDDFPVLHALITEHLEELAAGKISSISRAFKLSTAEVRKFIERIQHLNPKPLSGFTPGTEQYIIPDIIFTKNDDTFSISLNDDWVANYHINDYYMKMLNTTTDSELLEYFKGKLAHIQFIFSCIEQRRKTLLSIAEAILKEQSDFFEKGGTLHPMTMTSVAEQLEIHPSTLSRAIKGKYIQYPRGTILCKDLFSSAVSTGAQTDALSQADVKTIIKEIIDNENKAKPYSDQAIVKLLKAKDIDLSRRAVTKYRLELHIGSIVERKE